MSPDIVQGSPEWFAARAAKFTGSKFVNVMARAKADKTKKLKAYWDTVWQVVTERMTGVPPEEINAYSLRWGKDVEPFARSAYEIDTGYSVKEVGFIVHPKFAFAGCSPDGIIDADGGGILEIKCPKDSTIHLQRFKLGMEEDHVHQTQGNLWVTGLNWADFVSYDPRMPEPYRMFKSRAVRNEVYIAELEKAVIEAEADVRILLKEFPFDAPKPENQQ